MVTKVTVVQVGHGEFGTHWFIECSLCGTVDDVPLHFAVSRANKHREMHDSAENTTTT